MKRVITPSVTFNPTAKTLDMSGIYGFDFKRLYAVINQTRGVALFMTASAKYTATVAGNILTFAEVPANAQAGDDLMIIYDAGD